MTAQYRAVPTYLEAIQQGATTSASWYRFMQGIHLGTPPGSETTITVTASPFSFQAKQGGFAIVTGGTVSAIHFSRLTSHATGQTSGLFPLSAGDTLTITYSGAPSVVFVSQ